MHHTTDPEYHASRIKAIIDAANRRFIADAREAMARRQPAPPPPRTRWDAATLANCEDAGS